MNTSRLGARLLPVLAMLTGIALGASALFGPPVLADPGHHVKQGLGHWQAGRLDAAEASFRAALQEDPGHLDAHLKLGGLHLRQKRYGPATDSFQSAIGLDPGNGKLFTVLGMVYLHSGKLPLAHAAVSEALRLSPGLKEAQDLMRVVETRIESTAPHAAPHTAPGRAAGAK